VWRGDQALREERLSRRVEPVAGQGQARAAGARGGKTPALGLGPRDQPEREGPGRMAEVIQPGRTDQALLHPTAWAGHASEWRERARLLVHGGARLCEERHRRA
jgi:hypothetical protein